MPADAVMPVSVVIERRAGSTQWQDFVWQPIGVVRRSPHARGAMLAEGDGWAHFHGGSLDLELHRGETEGYLTNLSQEPPVVFVVLRQNEDAAAGEMDIEPFIVTACPYEAMGYTAGGDHVVEGVPMPPEVLAWVQEFVAHHHVDVPFQKRKNKRHQDDYGGTANSPRRGGGVS
jgi:hypothetical protein